MASNFNAFGLLLLVMATAIILWKFGRKPKKIFIILLAIIGFILFTFALGPRLFTSGTNGQPIFQIMIPATCLFLILIFINNVAIKLLIFVLFFLASLTLGQHYRDLVKTEIYTGNSNLTEDMLKLRKTFIVYDLLNEARINDNKYPPGWLRELLPEVKAKALKNIIGYLNNRQMHKIEIVHLWHSWFTGLYGKTEGEVIDVWFPGGTLKDSAEKIEFRHI
ncbi:MAG: hypothetical protein AB1306_11510 [Nitrospirota bacterium]